MYGKLVNMSVYYTQVHDVGQNDFENWKHKRWDIGDNIIHKQRLYSDNILDNYCEGYSCSIRIAY